MEITVLIVMLVLTGLALFGSILNVWFSSKRTSCVFLAGAIVRMAPCKEAPIYYVEEEEIKKDIWLSPRRHKPGWVALADGGYVQIEHAKLLSIFDTVP